MRRKPRGRGPWYGDERRLVRFECSARRWPGLRASTMAKGPDRGRRYSLEVDVPHYERRSVDIHFELESPQVPRVFVDGPTDSPHRYHADSGTLCMYDPGDPRDRRWTLDDGLLRLIGHIVAHLFREAWWRETGEWLGPEAPHSASKDPIKDPIKFDERRRTRTVDGEADVA